MTKRIGITLDDDLHAKLAALAQAERRSLVQQIVTILSKAVQK